ncbi:MAG: uridine kinase [Acholeplasmatales bacterium]|nr:uridine kinase [Acholeplasmatales bacterium]
MRPLLISIAGGTASGKTTVVSKIESYFNKDEVTVVCMDNYYKRRDDISLDDRKKINYDHPDAIDMELLKDHIRMLLAGKEIDSPVYDFSNHNRSNKTITVKPTKVIILEGILALYDEVIRDLSNILIFVESESDIRFIRRLKRDIISRGRSLDDVIMQYLSTVKPMYDSYVAPTKRYADIIIPNDTKHDMAIDILSAKIKEIIN